MSQKIYEMMTSRILDELAKGVVPWKKPWKSTGAPKNLITKKPYRGANTFVLGLAGYGSPWWLTFKQAADLGGSVRRGEKSTPVVFWSWKELDELDQDTNEKKRVPFLRYYSVFNLEQIDGIDPAKIPTTNAREIVDPIAEAEAIIENMPNRPTIEFGGDQAFYKPSADLVTMPRREKFYSEPEFYSTFFHELTHSTGHASRLGRFENQKVAAFGSEDYSREELVAEFGSAFLCGEAGIASETVQNQASYIEGWSQKLKDEPRLFLTAAAQAQKAADYILNRKPEGEGDN